MLQVVKGDVFEFGLSFGNVDPELIEKVVFACKELGIEEEADREEDEFRVRIPGEVTNDSMWRMRGNLPKTPTVQQI